MAALDLRHVQAAVHNYMMSPPLFVPAIPKETHRLAEIRAERPRCVWPLACLVCALLLARLFTRRRATTTEFKPGLAWISNRLKKARAGVTAPHRSLFVQANIQTSIAKGYLNSCTSLAYEGWNFKMRIFFLPVPYSCKMSISLFKCVHVII